MPAITVRSVTHSSSSRVEYKLPVAVRLLSEDWRLIIEGSNSKRDVSGNAVLHGWKDNLRRLASDTTLTALSLIYTDPRDDLLRELGGALADNSTLTGPVWISVAAGSLSDISCRG